MIWETRIHKTYTSCLAQTVSTWVWLRSVQIKSIHLEHHMVPPHSETPILRPQYSCQKPRSRTGETCLSRQNACLTFFIKHVFITPPCHNDSGVGFLSISLCAYRVWTVWEAYFFWFRPKSHPPYDDMNQRLSSVTWRLARPRVN